jgi:hypothetical protein
MLNFLSNNLTIQKKINDIVFSSDKNKKVTYYLFDFIPFLKVKQKGEKRKYYLFNFIPVMKRKEKK